MSETTPSAVSSASQPSASQPASDVESAVAPPASERRTALVTGASRGIGAHLARFLADAGWDVIGLSLSGTQDDPRVPVLACDVTDETQVGRAVVEAMKNLGRIDLLVNNAGRIESEAAPWEADPDEWWNVLEVNVRGPFLLSRAVVPRMIEAGGGRVVNLNSGSATRASGDLSAYAASKSALARLTGGLARAGAPLGVYAFDLAPGVVATDMTAGMRMHEGRTQWTDPATVAELLLALASGRLDAFTGRMVRAGADDPARLEVAAHEGLGTTARTLTLEPWGADDPLA